MVDDVEGRARELLAEHTTHDARARILAGGEITIRSDQALAAIAAALRSLKGQEIGDG